MKRLLSLPVAIALLAYEALDRLLGPLVRPAIAWLASLALFERLGRIVRSAPPYGLLALLVIPFIVIEPLKVAALYWMAVGHPVEGGATLVACHLLSLLTSERILHIGRDKLLTIRWFARLYRFVADLRDHALAWVRATAAWRAASETAQAIRAALRR